MGSVATDPTTGRNPEAIFGFLVAMMFAAWVFPMVAAAIKDGVTPVDLLSILLIRGPNCCLGGFLLLILILLLPKRGKKYEMALENSPPL